MKDYIIKVFDLILFPFLHYDNLLIFVPLFCIFFVSAWVILRRLMKL